MREAAASKVEALQRPKTRDVSLDDVERGVQSATRALTDMTQADGHICFELEADSTIPAEYVLLRHYLAEPVDAALEAKIASYLRRVQSGARRLATGP
jgi:squalene-hopene/tetraprenyl-beta-curcumene cyclase